MHWKRLIGITAAFALGSMTPAQAQPEVDVLIFGSSQARGVSIDACAALGYTWVWTQTEGSYLQYMPTKQWDLVVFELPEDLVTQKETVAGLLEDHVAAGGRLLINYNNLDEWPRLQKLMGVDVARDLQAHDRLLPSSPKHATWYNASLMNVGVPAWNDAGDELLPVQGSVTIGVFELSGAPSMVLANSERTIVNGFDWDSYFGASSMAHDQVEYLMECRADFDRSSGRGILDIFDFLEFQTLFVQQDPRANLNFDEQFDIFDFLAFQNAFVNGCA